MDPEDRTPPDEGGPSHHPAIDPVVGPSPVRRWALRLVLAVAVGLGSGAASAAFLHAMDWATDAFATHRLLLYALPVAGFAVGLVYHYAGSGSAAGNNLILDEIHEPQSWIPRRMAGLIFVATIVTHLFGGSAGREGTAVQMSGSIADGIGRRLRITGAERRILLIASIGAGFGGVFGVPIAGLVFALEVQAIKGLRRSALLPAAIASFVADETVRHLGIHHERLPSPGTIHLTPALLLKLAVAGVAFGLMSTVFAELMHRVHHWSARLVSWPPARPLIGGVLVIAATLLVGTRAYNGLSLPLIGLSLAGGAGVALGAFALKALFTALTLGTGFYGGEVTPLFVVGATLGATLGHLLDAPIPLLAAAGLVAVFAGASNTPIASTVLGLELFGLHPAYALVFALVCAVSYASSGSGGIYTSQRRQGWGFRHQPPLPA
jgi:H+/Cl- antiporter ClcA